MHPDDAQAQRLEGQPNGKTEAWYIIAANPGAWIIHGLRHPVEPGAFRRRLKAGTADDLLQKVQVTPGETIFVPAGTVHAIGPGVLLHEVQQTSDVTYRLYDWNRQAQGSKRELHLDKGLEVSRLQRSSHPVIQPLSWQEETAEASLLLACKYFTVKRFGLRGRMEMDTGARSFHILTVIDGECLATGVGSPPSKLPTGQSLLVPASSNPYQVQSDAGATILVEMVVDVHGDVVPELRERGIGNEAIQEFLAQFTP